MGRRIVKAIENSEDWNEISYHYYYDGQRCIEERNGSDLAIKQYVWGTQYVDELVQIRISPFPGDNNKCGYTFYPMHDANYNILGVASRTGRLIERYEYTPYGQRTVFSHGWLPADFDDDGVVDGDDQATWGTNYGGTGKTVDTGDSDCDGDVDADDLTNIGARYGMSVAFSDDPLVTHAKLESYRPSTYQPYGLCDIGHQGLMHDKEFGLIYNRARYLSPTLGRFTQRDPLGYVDGMNLYEYVGSNPVNLLDFAGLSSQVTHADIKMFEYMRDAGKFLQHFSLQGHFRTINPPNESLKNDILYFAGVAFTEVGAKEGLKSGLSMGMDAASKFAELNPWVSAIFNGTTEMMDIYDILSESGESGLKRYLLKKVKNYTLKWWKGKIKGDLYRETYTELAQTFSSMIMEGMPGTRGNASYDGPYKRSWWPGRGFGGPKKWTPIPKRYAWPKKTKKCKCEISYISARMLNWENFESTVQGTYVGPKKCCWSFSVRIDTTTDALRNDLYNVAGPPFEPNLRMMKE